MTTEEVLIELCDVVRRHLIRNYYNARYDHEMHQEDMAALDRIFMAGQAVDEISSLEPTAPASPAAGSKLPRATFSQFFGLSDFLG